MKIGKIQIDENGYIVKEDEDKNYLQNVDFGIVERARQVLKLDKEVTRVKITLANGNVLMNAKVIEQDDGKKVFENDVQNGVYIPKSQQSNGQVKFELDNEIIQGAQVEIEYSLKVTNISELDYLNEKYYWYGDEQNNQDLVTLNANNIIDYLDNNIAINTEEETIGKIVESKNSLLDEGLLDKTNETVKQLLNDTQKVYLINAFKKDLTPISKTNTENAIEIQKFKVRKLLSNISQGDETIFDNQAEIVKTVKSGGSSLRTMLGQNNEGVASESETVSIVPPTGLNTDYIAYTILAISSLGILTCGIVLIKKFVLN